jgi:hypothetical protein
MNEVVRRSRRIFVELPVLARSGGARVEMVAGDVSIEGLFLRAEALLPVGEELELEACVPQNEPIQMRVRVVFAGRSVSGRGVGVEIVRIDEAARDRWQRYYESITPRRGTLGSSDDARI